MQYTFAAGIRILDPATYSSLTDAQRVEARKLLFSAIQPIVDAMGAFETDKPLEFLEAHLAAVPGGAWSPGAPLSTDVHYIVDPVTGEVICIRDYTLQRDGSQFTATVQVGGKDLKSAFFVHQTAIN